MTRFDYTLLTIAAAATAGILIAQYCKPLPFRKRIWVQVKAVVGR